MAKEKKKTKAEKPEQKSPAEKAEKTPPEKTKEEENPQPEETSVEKNEVKDPGSEKSDDKSDDQTHQDGSEDTNGEELPEGAEEAESLSHMSGNIFLRKLMDSNFIEYASYVIKERAIPDVDDGLKPVQRRILWSLFKMDDGKFHKVANVIGDTMKYHPHGDAAIGDALVVLANKEFYIEKQGNFGNILTGDVASAARYIECRLTPLAKEVLFNNDITEFTDSYDGRNKEPVTLPVKIPSLLMIGADGIAVGMATKIMPHNFKELLEAQIAILRKQKVEIYPDFVQGGIMDVSEYEDGNGKITLRAKIDREGRKLIIREIPATTTTESLIASIERAVSRNKMKLASINDYTTEKVEIEIVPMRGYDPEKCLKALYAYTDCSVSISGNLTVICDNKPCIMSVTEVLTRNTEKLREYLQRELEIELGKLEDRFHDKTLAQIFIENRIYKRIEECKTYELVLSEVHEGLKKFRKMLKREITDEDVEKLLAIPIRRISLFDINKNKKDIDDILKQIEEVQKNLRNLTKYAVKYLNDLIKKYAENYVRKTEIEEFDRIDKQAVALNNIKVGWDRKGCYIGTSVRSDERVTCNEYDHLLCIERKGNYRVISIPDKLFVGRLYYFTKYDKDQVYYIVYSEKKTGKFYAKQTVIDKFIRDKEYNLCPKGCKIEIITTRVNSLYEFKVDIKVKDKKKLQYNLSDAPERSPKARGFLIAPKKILGFKFIEIIEENPEEEVIDEEGNVIEVKAEEVADTPTEKQDKKEEQGDTPIVKKEKQDDNKKETENPPENKPSDSKKESSKKTKKTESDEKEAKKPPAKKETKAKSEKQKKTKSSPAKEPQKKGKSKKDDDDDLGISQPEFGF
jgi:topoisomerase-4 subunit A